MARPSAKKSTIVRSIRYVERWAPAVAVHYATRAWWTVPPPIPQHRLPPLPPGSSTPVDLDGRPLHAISWGSGEPVYLVHGWGGRSEQLGEFVGPLVAAGHAVVAFDAPGHGASPPGAFGPRTTTIPEFAAALRATERSFAERADNTERSFAERADNTERSFAAYGRPRAVIAHSMGAAVVAHALRTGLRPQAIVLLAPVADPRRALDMFVARIGAGPRVRAGVERAVARRVRLPWDAFDVPSLASAIEVPPTLVVHDRDDREVGPDQGRAIADAWPDARLHLTDGLGHRRLLRDAAVVDEVVRFVTGAESRTARRPA